MLHSAFASTPENEIKAILFDDGGVLQAGADQESLRKLLDVDLITFQKAWQTYYPLYSVGKTSVSKFIEGMYISTNSRAKAPSEKSLIDYLKNELEQEKEVLQLVKALRKKGYIVGLFTNTSVQYEVSSAAGNYESLFDFQILSRHSGVVKPHPLIYEKAASLLLKRWGITRGQTVIIDDKARNIEAAVGMYGILFKDGKQLKRDLHGLGIAC